MAGAAPGARLAPATAPRGAGPPADAGRDIQLAATTPRATSVNKAAATMPFAEYDTVMHRTSPFQMWICLFLERTQHRLRLVTRVGLTVVAGGIMIMNNGHIHDLSHSG